MTNEEAIKEIISWTPILLSSAELSENAGEAQEMAISALSVPEREKGEWVYSERFSKVFPMHECSKCSGLSASCYVKFCPNCGADMRGET